MTKRSEQASGPRIRVRQIRSGIGFAEDQKATLRALGLGKLHRIRDMRDTPELRGMLRKVRHLVEVLDGGATREEVRG